MPAGSDHGYLRTEIEAGLAVVFLDRPPGFLDADTVLTANREGARLGVEHLLGQGHRRIAFLGDLEGITTARDRRLGYLDAMRSSGTSVPDELVRMGLHTSAMAQEAVTDLLALPAAVAPTAIFASQNLLTVGAIRALRRLGLQHRVALIGFDDIELADELEPAITVVAQDPLRLGGEAADLMFARLDGYRGPSQHRVVPTKLIARGSGEIPPTVT
jgi:LacI family transcriptional regulator